MDADNLFNGYLNTWPDAWIMWPEGKNGQGREKMKTLFQKEGEDPLSPHFLFNDLLDYIKEDCMAEKKIQTFSSSEWLQKYFKTVRGRNMVRAHMQKHEPMMACVMFNATPLKQLMDGFFIYVIDKEVRPCLTV